MKDANHDKLPTRTICERCNAAGLVDIEETYDHTEFMGHLTVRELRRVIAPMRDDAIVSYERIEDSYFTKHGWKPSLTIPEGDPLYADINNEYIHGFCCWKYEKDNQQYLLISAHY